jgi:hypothetical protein
MKAGVSLCARRPQLIPCLFSFPRWPGERKGEVDEGDGRKGTVGMAGRGELVFIVGGNTSITGHCLGPSYVAR